MIYLEFKRKEVRKLLKVLPKGKLRRKIKAEYKGDTYHFDPAGPTTKGPPVTLMELAQRQTSPELLEISKVMGIPAEMFKDANWIPTDGGKCPI